MYGRILDGGSYYSRILQWQHEISRPNRSTYNAQGELYIIFAIIHHLPYVAVHKIMAYTYTAN
jgi:hypothetical protein